MRTVLLEGWLGQAGGAAIFDHVSIAGSGFLDDFDSVERFGQQGIPDFDPVGIDNYLHKAGVAVVAVCPSADGPIQLASFRSCRRMLRRSLGMELR